MKYCTYDNEGKITGFYDSEINTNIPTTNTISLSYEEWLDLAEYQIYRTINPTSKKIVKGVVLTPTTRPPNWEGFISSLRNSNLFYKLYGSAKTNLALNTIYTTLLNSFNMKSIADLEFALNEINSIKSSVAITAADVTTINTLLTNNNFTFRII